jgi:hypothetical protein
MRKGLWLRRLASYRVAYPFGPVAGYLASYGLVTKLD